VAFLVLTAIGNSAWSVAYLLVFGLGTILGMMLITMGLAWSVAGFTPRFAHLPRRLRLASGVISLIAGIAIAYQIGVVDGLFGAAPRWAPR
jgi:high-affinity nickel-transport protein